MRYRFLIIACFSLCVIISLANPLSALAETGRAAAAGPVLKLKVSTAKQSYSAGETVKMSAVITGTGHKSTRFFVIKGEGSGAGLAYEGTAKTGEAINDSWNTKDAAPGMYDVIAVVYGEGGAELQAAGSTFNVTVPVTGLTLNNTKLSLEKGDTFQLTAEVSPKEANQAVSYQTSDSSVASVAPNGLITAKKTGTATITASAEDGSKKATCTVSISQYKSNVNRLVSAAVKYLGTLEDPPDSNLVTFNDWYFGKTGMAVPWCGVFVTKVISDAGMMGTTWGSLNTARKSVAEGVRNYKTLAQRQDRWITSGYKRGDIVLFDWQSNGDYDHIGIIESVSASGKTITTIEGNTSDPAGIQVGDVGVYRKTRTVDGQVLGAYRPPYEK